jgi:hypothetical protein
VRPRLFSTMLPARRTLFCRSFHVRARGEEHCLGRYECAGVLPETKAGTTRTRKAGEMACYRSHGQLCAGQYPAVSAASGLGNETRLWGEIAS